MEIQRFTVRTSGRNIREVRRPRKPVDLTALKKAELAAIAEARGVDTTGTRADILERLEPDAESADD